MPVKSFIHTAKCKRATLNNVSVKVADEKHIEFITIINKLWFIIGITIWIIFVLFD